MKKSPSVPCSAREGSPTRMPKADTLTSSSSKGANHLSAKIWGSWAPKGTYAGNRGYGPQNERSVADWLRFRVKKWYVLPRPAGQPLLPRCYQNTPHQEHPGAPSVSPNPRVFVRIGLPGSAQVGPGKNYESVVGCSNHPGRTQQIYCRRRL